MDKKLQNFLTTSLTFGTNTKHKVAVVQKIIKNESKTKTKSLRSDNTNDMAAPAMHVMNTLYTEKPMCFESFRAGIET